MESSFYRSVLASRKLLATLSITALVLPMLSLSPSATAQSAITGTIASYPQKITPEISFTFNGTSNARKVRFELWQGTKRLWYTSSITPTSAGAVSATGKLSYSTPLGQATLILQDYDTKTTLDQETVEIVPPVGTITKFPTIMQPSVNFTLEAQSNARKVRFELWRGTKRLWYTSSITPTSAGIVTVTSKLSSTTTLGDAVLKLLDYDTKRILDEETVSVAKSGGSSSTSSSNSSTTSSAQSSQQSSVILSSVLFDDFSCGLSTERWEPSFVGSTTAATVGVANGLLNVNADGRIAPDDSTTAIATAKTTVEGGIDVQMKGSFGGSHNYAYLEISDGGTKWIRLQLNRAWPSPDNVIVVSASGYSELENTAPHDTTTVTFTEDTMYRYRILQVGNEIHVMKDATVLARYTGSIATGSVFRAVAKAAWAPDRYAFLSLDSVSFYRAGSSNSSATQCPGSSQQSSTSSTSSSATTVAPFEFSLPDFPDNGRVAEGDWVKAAVSNGIGRSAVYIDVLYDGSVAYSHGFAETDDSGNSFVQFQMPYRLLKSGHTEDGLVIRLSHGNIAYTRSFTLVKGLSIGVPDEIKENQPFTYTIENSAGETLVEAGINYDAGQDPRFPNRDTDGSGNASITVTMPPIITNGADRDGAEFWVKTKDVTWYFPVTIIRDQSAQPSGAQANVKKVVAGNGATINYPLAVGGAPAASVTADQTDLAKISAPSLFDRSRQTLVVILLGSNQTLGETTGMNTVYGILNSKLKHVTLLETGANPSGWTEPSLSDANYHMGLNKNAINLILNSYPEINSVVLVGFSWGASAAYELTYWLKDTRPNIRLLGTAYVDGIDWHGPTSAEPLTKIHPLVESAFNIFQSRACSYCTPGAPVLLSAGDLEPVGYYLGNKFNLLPVSNYSAWLGKYYNHDMERDGHYLRHAKEINGSKPIHLQSFVITMTEQYVRSVIEQAFPN